VNGQCIFGNHFPAAGTRFKPASPASLRAQTIPASGLVENGLLFL